MLCIALCAYVILPFPIWAMMWKCKLSYLCQNLASRLYCICAKFNQNSSDLRQLTMFGSAITFPWIFFLTVVLEMYIKMLLPFIVLNHVSLRSLSKSILWLKILICYRCTPVNLPLINSPKIYRTNSINPIVKRLIYPPTTKAIVMLAYWYTTP